MGTRKVVRSHRSWSIVNWQVATSAIVVVGLGLGYAAFGTSRAVVAAQGRPGAASLQGMGSVSGTVTAAKPFKAAQVYIRNVDKRVLYMVYTNAGAFRAVALF